MNMDPFRSEILSAPKASESWITLFDNYCDGASAALGDQHTRSKSDGELVTLSTITVMMVCLVLKLKNAKEPLVDLLAFCNFGTGQGGGCQLQTR